jgi:DNA repair protein RecN (Recombination protein N)
LTHSLRELDALIRLDARLTPVSELLNAALIQLQEASSELRGYVQDLDLDPAHLARVEQRLTAAHQLARKHRLAPRNCRACGARFEAELDASNTAKPGWRICSRRCRTRWPAIGPAPGN